MPSIIYYNYELRSDKFILKLLFVIISIAVVKLNFFKVRVVVLTVVAWSCVSLP